jgi:hypothetical protein
MKASKVIKYIVWGIIVFALLSYGQELNDCLMK